MTHMAPIAAKRGDICVFMAAYEAGRRARIAGLARAANPHRMPILLIGVMADMMARVNYCWDAGWIFGERAARAAGREA